MNILTNILLTIVGIVVLLLIIAVFMKRDHYVKREIVINAPVRKVFNYMKLLKNQNTFNKWAMAGKEGRREEYEGTDGTIGFSCKWSGEKGAGEGEKQITEIIEGRKIEIETRYVKPFHTVAQEILEAEYISPNQTKVSMINKGKLSYPMNMLVPLLEKNFPKDIDESLNTLKRLLEN